MWWLPCHLLHKQVLLGSGFFKSQLPVQSLGQEGLVYWVGHFVFTVAAKEAETGYLASPAVWWEVGSASLWGVFQIQCGEMSNASELTRRASSWETLGPQR